MKGESIDLLIFGVVIVLLTIIFAFASCGTSMGENCVLHGEHCHEPVFEETEEYAKKPSPTPTPTYLPSPVPSASPLPPASCTVSVTGLVTCPDGSFYQIPAPAVGPAGPPGPAGADGKDFDPCAPRSN